MHILEGWGRHNARGAPNPCCHNSQPTRKERPDSPKRLEGTLSAIATEHGAPKYYTKEKRHTFKGWCFRHFSQTNQTLRIGSFDLRSLNCRILSYGRRG
jgi:hypothetical protein